VLKLVGATDGFVMAPFLLEGAIHGLAAVVLSLVLMAIGHGVVDERVPQITFMTPGMVVSFVAFGVVVAVLGSWISLRAFIGEKSRG
jgi:cell division protein FtsX